jgi:hypothetical protein
MDLTEFPRCSEISVPIDFASFRVKFQRFHYSFVKPHEPLETDSSEFLLRLPNLWFV